jgi:hypothetical protein
MCTTPPFAMYQQVKVLNIENHCDTPNEPNPTDQMINTYTQKGWVIHSIFDSTRPKDPMHSITIILVRDTY